jgi:hypothetical protein
MLKVSEGDRCKSPASVIYSILLFFLQFIPVIGSRELEGKAAKAGVGFGGDQ